MNVMVTGSRGFIGHHLVKALRAAGHTVHCYDIKDGHDVRLMKEVELHGIKIIYHLAAIAQIPKSMADPEMTHDHNVNGTLHVLDTASKTKVKRVVYAASSSAYGIQDSLPNVETMKPNPMSPYAVQKLVGEYYCKVYADLFGIETVALRFFNVYGEDMPINGPYSACIANFLIQYRNELPLTVFGGAQTRDFTYVHDVVAAIMAAGTSFKVGKGEVINIGSGVRTSITQLANYLSDNISYSEQRKGEPMDSLADISKAKKLLDWEPKGNLKQWLQSQQDLKR